MEAHNKLKSAAYISLVGPHLETCASVWSPHKVSREQLEQVQRRGMRWISGARWNGTLNQWMKDHKECSSINAQAANQPATTPSPFLLSDIQECKQFGLH